MGFVWPETSAIPQPSNRLDRLYGLLAYMAGDLGVPLVGDVEDEPLRPPPDLNWSYVAAIASTLGWSQTMLYKDTALLHEQGILAVERPMENPNIRLFRLRSLGPLRLIPKSRGPKRYEDMMRALQLNPEELYTVPELAGMTRLRGKDRARFSNAIYSFARRKLGPGKRFPGKTWLTYLND